MMNILEIFKQFVKETFFNSDKTLNQSINTFGVSYEQTFRYCNEEHR